MHIEFNETLFAKRLKFYKAIESKKSGILFATKAPNTLFENVNILMMNSISKIFIDVANIILSVQEAGKQTIRATAAKDTLRLNYALSQKSINKQVWKNSCRHSAAALNRG